MYKFILSVAPFSLLVLVFYTSNFHLTQFDYTLITGFFILIISNILWVLFWIGKNKVMPLLPLAGAISFVVNSTMFFGQSRITYMVYVFLTLIVFLIILYFDKRKLLVNIFIPVVILTKIITLLYMFMDASIVYNKVNSEYKKIKVQRGLTKKYSVYYLVVDTYPSTESMHNDNIDNKNFIKWLEKNNFSINHRAYSNYDSTVRSMWSTLKMKHNLLKDYTKKLGSYMELFNVIDTGKNDVVKTFLKNDYTVYVRNSIALDEKKMNKTSLFNGNDLRWFLKYYKLLYYAVRVKSTFINILSRDILNKVEGEMYFSTFLKNLLNKNSPMFLYLHGVEVHADETNCITNQADFKNLIGFRQQIKCINSDIKEAVKYINKNDPNAIIILQSDHGSTARYWFSNKNYKQEIIQRFGILFAVKWPKQCEYLGKQKYTPVNLFPRVFACLSGKKPDYEKLVPDDSYIFKRQLVNKPNIDSEVLKVIKDNKIIDF